MAKIHLFTQNAMKMKWLINKYDITKTCRCKYSIKILLCSKTRKQLS